MGEDMIEEKVFEAFKKKNNDDHAKITTEIRRMADILEPIEAEFQDRETINKLGMRIGNGLIFASKVILAMGIIYGVVSGTFAGWFGK